MLRHITLIGVLAIVAAVIAGALPAGAQTAGPGLAAQPASVGRFGMNTYFTGLERNGRDGAAGVTALIGKGRGIGAAWAREELSWGNIERSGKGRWSWEPFDSRLAEAARAGYGIVGMLLTTPAWARVGDCDARRARYPGARGEDYWCPPASAQDFADYVRAVVERYDGDGLADAPGSPRVAAWQIWNEPNAWETWPGSPAEFAAIWEAGYAAARAADPTATVASPGVYVFDGHWSDGAGHGDGLRFIDEALAARPSLWASFDALAVHPYMPDVAPDQPGLYGAVSLWGRLSTARSWLDERARRYGGPSKPLWVSEVGWSTCTAAQADCYAGLAAHHTECDGCLCGEGLSLSAALPIGCGEPAPAVFRGPSAAGGAAPRLAAPQLAALVGKSEDQQASYLVRSYGIAMALGVQHLSWFQLEDKFDGSAGNFWEEAAILGTAAEGYRAKPAAQAYATMAGLLAGARYLGAGPLHSYVHSQTASTPAARFNLRFLTADNRIVDLLWRNGGAETASLPLEPGRAAELRSRDGAALGLSLAGGAARVPIGEGPVYLIQSAAPALAVAPAGLTVIARPGDQPQTLEVRVANLGSGVISWSAAASAGWATVQAPSGQGQSGALSVRVSPAGLRPGRYGATLRVSSSIGARDIPLTLIVSEQAQRLRMPLVRR